MKKTSVIVLFLIIMGLFPMIITSQSTPPIAYLISANWKSVPSLFNTTQIGVNLVLYYNFSQIHAYTLIFKVFLPKGIVNTSYGNEIQNIIALSPITYVYQINFQLSVKILNQSLPNRILFPVSLTFITIEGNEITYYSNFSLQYYGIPNVQLAVLNDSLRGGYNNLTLLISSNSSVYNLKITSPYFLNSIYFSNLNSSRIISVKTFIPFGEDLVNIPINVSYLTIYGLYNTKYFLITKIVNETNLLYTKVLPLTFNFIYSGFVDFNITLINNEKFSLNNFTLVVNYNGNEKSYFINYLPPNSSTSLILGLYTNSSITLNIYGYFLSPLGIQNISLGKWYFPLTSPPIELTLYNNTLNITNLLNEAVKNVTISTQFGKIEINSINSGKYVLLNFTKLITYANVSLYINSERIFFPVKVKIIPVLATKLAVSYSFANISTSLSSASALLLLTIANEGNTQISNVYIIVNPNGAYVIPYITSIPQLLPNESITIPFNVYSSSNKTIGIKIEYYSENFTHTENINVNFNFIKKPTITLYLSKISDYLTYPILGIPSILILFLVIFIGLIFVPSIKSKNKKLK
ncbi:hypothetical protein SJAV_27660 [Sulfurisphaera javensis]|uniref:CARDB domain-containing protein n=1 Tax=Sulfurisphaera javensis TaxID=2049879 RepID=A0AAT9GVK1_9CREN